MTKNNDRSKLICHYNDPKYNGPRNSWAMIFYSGQHTESTTLPRRFGQLGAQNFENDPLPNYMSIGYNEPRVVPIALM
jgi:hypothetical protein